MSGLPVPPAEALAQSQTLTASIRHRIAAAGGWLSFADYMAMALYEPGLGYYVAGARKFGSAGDFVTAPELTPLFGQVLASQFAEVLSSLGGGDVLELGAGSGRLAADILLELERLDCLPRRYCILELSPDLRQRQMALLSEAVPQLMPRLVWLDRLPEIFSGVVFGNEVLDALPVHLLHWRRGRCYERGIVSVDSAQASLAWHDRDVAEGALSEAASRLPVPEDGDYLSEVSLAVPALVRSLGGFMTQGMVLFLEAGFPRAEYYHRDRAGGTLMCHYRHRAFGDPLYLPGLVDVTAHVDFTAVADAALDAGLDVLGYTSQAHFLLNGGLLDRLAQLGPGSMGYLKQASAVHKLVQPSEMGELFKVIALGKEIDSSLTGFSRGDKRHTL